MATPFRLAGRAAGQPQSLPVRAISRAWGHDLGGRGHRLVPDGTIATREQCYYVWERLVFVTRSIRCVESATVTSAIFERAR